ncbi:hypothetical protein JRQ81_019883, partial [Phrynocephalus forsythii]
WHAAWERPPDILVIHVGGNDVGKLMNKALINSIVQDLGVWQEQFPNTHMAWSTIIPRRTWEGESDQRRMNHTSRGVNWEVAQELLKAGGSVIGHCHINTNKLDLYRSDGVHLSTSGLDLFLSNLHGGL